MALLQSQVHGADVRPLVHDVELQGEGGAVQGVLRAAAVLLSQPPVMHPVQCHHAHLAPVEVELQHLVAAIQGAAGHQPHRTLGVHLLQLDTVCCWYY